MITELTKMFEGHEVRVIGTAMNPLFVAKDVCDVLGIKNSRDAISKLDDSEKGVGNYDTLGGPQEMTLVTESGLYHLVFKSRKQSAKRFRRWITEEVIPSIRKTGSYGVSTNQTDVIHHAVINTVKDLIELGVTPDKASACASNTYKESFKDSGNINQSNQLAPTPIPKANYDPPIISTDEFNFDAIPAQ